MSKYNIGDKVFHVDVYQNAYEPEFRVTIEEKVVLEPGFHNALIDYELWTLWTNNIPHFRIKKCEKLVFTVDIIPRIKQLIDLDHMHFGLSITLSHNRSLGSIPFEILKNFIIHICARYQEKQIWIYFRLDPVFPKGRA